jgi:hypothetical protein
LVPSPRLAGAALDGYVVRRSPTTGNVAANEHPTTTMRRARARLGQAQRVGPGRPQSAKPENKLQV